MSVEPGIVDANILIYAVDADAPQPTASRALLDAARDHVPKVSKMAINPKAPLIAPLMLATLMSLAGQAEAHDQVRVVYMNSGNIYAINSDGSDKRALTSEGHNNMPTWSPDGKKILYLHDTPTGKTVIPRR